MSAADLWFFLLLGYGIVATIAGVCIFAHAKTAHEERERSEEMLSEHRLAVSSVTNSITIAIGWAHPQVEPVCMAIETALLAGSRPDTDTLMRALETIQRAQRMAILKSANHIANGGAR